MVPRVATKFTPVAKAAARPVMTKFVTPAAIQSSPPPPMPMAMGKAMIQPRTAEPAPLPAPAPTVKPKVHLNVVPFIARKVPAAPISEVAAVSPSAFVDAAPVVPTNMASPPQPGAAYSMPAAPQDDPREEEPKPPTESDYPTDEAPPPGMTRADEMAAAMTWESDVPWQEMQGFAGEGDEPDEFMQVFAHVQGDELCATGICKTPYGLIPLTYSVQVNPEVPNGVVSAGADAHPDVLPAIDQSLKELEMLASDKAQALAAEKLVLRSREGDQNAMGTIVMIKQNAMHGLVRAKRSVELMNEYIRMHPATETNPFGQEGPTKPESNVLLRTAVKLANGAPVSVPRIAAIADRFKKPEDRSLFLYATQNFGEEGLLDRVQQQRGEWAKQVAELGKNVGYARALQRAREPDGSISDFSPNAGWELGE